MTGSSRPGRLLAYLVPFVAAMALYGVTLGYDLTYDDYAHMKRPGVPETRTWTQIWTTPTEFYRPLVTATFRVESRLGLPLWERHGLNVLLNAAVTLLVVRLALSLGLGIWISGAAGLLFAVHPAHVEAVAGLVGRADVLAALCLLLALWLHDRALLRGRAGLGTLVGTALFAFLAANSKESAWGLPAFALALHLARRRPVRRFESVFAAYVVGIGGHLLLRHHALGGWIKAPTKVIPAINNPLVDVSGLERLVDGLRVGGVNLIHLVFPVTLAPDYSGPEIALSGGITDPRLWLGVLLVLGPVAAVILGLRRRGAGGRALVVGAVWLFVSAFLVMNLVYSIDTVLGDRLLYWPSIAWVLLLAGGATLWIERRREPAARAARPRLARWITVSLLGLLAVGYTWRAAEYVPDWKNNRTLFQAATVATPEVPRAWYNLAWSYHQEGRLQEAIAGYRKALELAPNLDLAYSQEAAAQMALGNWDEGGRLLERALRLKPDNPLTLTNAGIYWMHADSLAKAVSFFHRSLKQDPIRTDAWYNLGLAQKRLGHTSEAEQAFRRCMEIDPRDAGAAAKVAELLAAQPGRAAEGEALARRAVRLDATNPYYQGVLAECLFREGKREAAMQVLWDALRRGDDPDLRKQLARYKASTGP